MNISHIFALLGRKVKAFWTDGPMDPRIDVPTNPRTNGPTDRRTQKSCKTRGNNLTMLWKCISNSALFATSLHEFAMLSQCIRNIAMDMQLGGPQRPLGGSLTGLGLSECWEGLRGRWEGLKGWWEALGEGRRKRGREKDRKSVVIT